MSWLKPGANLEEVLALRPRLAEGFEAFLDELYANPALSERVLELVRLRIACIHAHEAEQQRSESLLGLSADELDDVRRAEFSRFGTAEQAALRMAENMPFNHHAVSDRDVAALSECFGHGGAVALLTAAALFDTICRWKEVLAVSAHPGNGRLERPRQVDG